MKVKLGDVYNLQMGKTPARDNLAFWGGKNKWISISDIGNTGKYISSTKESITDEAVKKSGIKIVPKGTVLMSFKLSIGKVAITLENMYSNEAIMAFIDKKVCHIDTNYFYYLLLGKNWNLETNKAVMGLTLNKATLSQIEVEIPSLEKQIYVASILDKVSDLIDLRKQQLAKLDELVKSRFVEMFGDIPQSEYVVMQDVCSLITDGTHQPPKFIDNGIPFLLVSNVTSNEISYDTEKFISEETYTQLMKRTPIEVGDILLSTVGSYGHPAIVKSDKRFSFQRHIAFLKPKRQILNSIYLHSAILSSDMQEQIEAKVNGVAQKTLNLSEIKTLRLPLPKIERQNAFSIIIRQINKTKSAIQKSLEETQLLFDSLMQTYFG